MISLRTNSSRQVLISAIVSAVVASSVFSIYMVTSSSGNTGNKDITHIPLRILPEPASAKAVPPAEVSGCFPSSLEALASKPTIPVRTPHVLPVGYNLRAVDHISGNWVILYYWDKPMCPFEFHYTTYALKGAIVIGIMDTSTVQKVENLDEAEYAQQLADPAAYAKFIIRDTPEVNYKMLMLNGTLGGNPAAGIGPYLGKSIVYENGVIVSEEPLPSPANLFFIHQSDGTEYRILANMPLEDLVKVAESIS